MRVFVTGGTSGIGLALATRLARAGSRVWICAPTAGALDASVASIRAVGRPGQRVGGTVVDVADRAAVEASRDEVLRGLGGLDLLINNAGIATVGRLEDTSAADYERMMAVNYLGSVWTTRAFLPALIASRGAVCFVASTLGVIGLFGYTAYAPSKFAVVGYAECLRQELLGRGVTVHVAFPADVDTPQLRANLSRKPRETAALAGLGSVLSAEQAAEQILDGIARRRARIGVGVANRALLWAGWHFPGIVRAVVDRSLRRREVGP